MSDLAPRELCRSINAFPLGVHCSGVRVGGSGNPDDRAFLDGLRRAIEDTEGAILLDTADSYGKGKSERLIGRVLREYTGLPLQVGSKVGTLHSSAEHPYADRRINHQLQQTLDNLYVDQLALYTLQSLDFGPHDRFLGHAADQMCTLRDLELIRAVGMPGPDVAYTASPEQQSAAVAGFLKAFRAIGPDVIWTRFNALTPNVLIEGDDLFTFARRHGVGVVLTSPLARGLLIGKSPSSATVRPHYAMTGTALGTPHNTGSIARGLQSLRDRFGPYPGALTRVALRFCLQRANHSVVLVGFRTEAQVAESFGCLGEPLTNDELAFMEGTFAEMRASLMAPVQAAMVAESRR
ncbi:aldo/keto reductase [Streptomyces umbrinus]|uniref:aldo/keto reductase n=1 Tax=Streptomyces umbrinus TaxID=67370 RepID=UPI001677BE53|nr:aldo/keto reductase [Streptomyces umbrinus]GHB81797.1 aldo/keto reductase [Streptomyces umbrinus]